MPVFNGETFLRQTLDSLLAQDYENFELIISDNASTDGTAAICREYAARDRRIRFYQNGRNLGPVFNFRRVFDLARGRYFMWAGDHDLWHPGFISSCLEVLEKDPEVVLAYTHTLLIDNNGNTLEMMPDQLDTRGLNPLDRFKKIIWELGFCNMFYGLFRADVLKKISFPRRVAIGGDNVILADLSLHGAIAQIPAPLFYRRDNLPGETPDQARKRRLDVRKKAGYDYEVIIPFTLLAYAHLEVIEDAKLTNSEKKYLFDEVKRCFFPRYKLQMEQEKEAFRITMQRVAFDKLTNKDYDIICRLEKAIKTFFPNIKLPDRSNKQSFDLIDIKSTQKMPFISIVIPTYNRARYLGDAINSALAQQYENMEVLIVDDGSTDNTPEIVSGFTSEKIRYLLKEHSGAPATRNYGVREAKGDFILWLDSDDVLLPDTVNTYVALLKQFPKVDVFYGNLLVTNDQLNDQKKIQYEDWFGRNSELLAKLFKVNSIPNPGSMVRRECFQRIGMFDETFKRAHDYEWWSRLAPVANFKNAQTLVVKWRWHNSNMSSESVEIDWSYDARIIHLMLERYSLRDLFPQINFSQLSPQIAEGLAYMQVAQRLLELKDKEGALRYLKMSHELYPSGQTYEVIEELSTSLPSASKNNKSELDRKREVPKGVLGPRRPNLLHNLGRNGESSAKRATLKAAALKGCSFYCPLCEKSYPQFLPFGVKPRPNACCPGCGSLERHRLLWVTLCALKEKGWLRPGGRLLHVAPEPCLTEKLKTEYDYLSVNLNGNKAMMAMDITAMTFADNTFDAVVCNHVLEHIPDDIRAIKELFRVLKPGGWASLLVPIKGDITQEDLSITDPKERLRLYGQEDHVRYYGRDFADRLQNAGFEVLLIPKSDLLDHSELERLSVDCENYVVLCKKLKINYHKAADSEVMLSQNEMLGQNKPSPDSLQAYHNSAELINQASRTSEAPVQPLVSVIVPTFNRPDTLVVALQSILDQTFQNFEIIVVNDYGVDVADIVGWLNQQGNITYVKHDRNRGLAAARNTGLRLARGKYIAYLDDDDLFYPDHLETLVNFLETTNYHVAYTDAHRAYQVKDKGRYVTRYRDLPHSNDFDAERLLIVNQFPVLCLMHEKSCLEPAGLFDETLTTHEDWDLWIRLSFHYQFSHIKKVTCEFTWRQDGSTMTSHRTTDFARTMEIIYEKYRPLLQDKPHIPQIQRQYLEQYRALLKASPSAPQASAEDLLAAAQAALNRRDWAAAESILRQCLNNYPDIVETHLVITRGTSASQISLESSPPRISVVIPVFNNLDLNRQCLDSIYRGTNLQGVEIIVVDNGSTDGSTDYLRQEENCGRLRLIDNIDNLGFAKACNQGARAARGNLLVFLNNDTVVQPGWLEGLTRCLEKDERIGIVGAKLLYPDNTIQHAGVTFDDHKRVGHIYRYFHHSHPAVNKEREFQVVTAACMMIRKTLFLAVGGFDEHYQNGFEDVDLCLQIRHLGYKVYYTPQCVVYHLESKTAGRHAREKENGRYFISKWGERIIPDQFKYYQEDGISLELVGHHDNGKPTYVMHDHNVNIYWQEAARCREQGVFSQAIENYRLALQFNPFDHRQYAIATEFADTYELIGNIPEAVKLYQQIVDLSLDPKCQYKLAWLQKKLGHFQEAIKNLEQAKETLEKSAAPPQRPGSKKRCLQATKLKTKDPEFETNSDCLASQLPCPEGRSL